MAQWVDADLAAAPTILAPTFTISSLFITYKPNFTTNLSRENSEHPIICPNGNIGMDHFLIFTLIMCTEGDHVAEVLLITDMKTCLVAHKTFAQLWGTNLCRFASCATWKNWVTENSEHPTDCPNENVDIDCRAHASMENMKMAQASVRP
jgi:hypothetical protein